MNGRTPPWSLIRNVNALQHVLGGACSAAAAPASAARKWLRRQLGAAAPTRRRRDEGDLMSSRTKPEQVLSFASDTKPSGLVHTKRSWWMCATSGSGTVELAQHTLQGGAVPFTRCLSYGLYVLRVAKFVHTCVPKIINGVSI